MVFAPFQCDVKGGLAFDISDSTKKPKISDITKFEALDYFANFIRFLSWIGV